MNGIASTAYTWTATLAGRTGCLAEAMMIAWFVGVLTQLVGFWLPAGHVAASPSPSGLMAVAAIALTGMLVAFLAYGTRIAAAMPITQAGR